MNTKLKSLLATLRQWRHPRAFRIPEPAWPEEWEQVLHATAAGTDTGAPQSMEATEEQGAAQDGASLVKREREERAWQRFLCDQATHLWRLRGRMEDANGEPKEAFRREFRHVQALWDALKDAGVEIQDHTGSWFDAGLALKVVAFQPTPGVTRERVQETIKPSVYLRGASIQMGEVIVEIPEKAPSPAVTGTEPSGVPAPGEDSPAAPTGGEHKGEKPSAPSGSG